jgi:hypothetical protein
METEHWCPKFYTGMQIDRANKKKMASSSFFGSIEFSPCESSIVYGGGPNSFGK